ncbi:LysR family transcriptional regulator [Cupriavidus sp. AU9028]|uniref:LysR family transcriptional regulator n=1 Tax=Cupriavidus sp. AU9028 TaxID=2871157 RepID=UPI001C94BC2B|nr:LysR family transcriptional regulator [Cupriavidus sp. AU9028]MBY4897456.1 LysR family transcriptional regulator [Cupriavidus sp. AU9028]
MEIRQLEAFAAVMSTGSLTAAGRLLGRSQPAITRSIQELEAQLGFALFARSGPRVSPTARGFLFYEEVEPVLLGMQQIRASAAQIGREGSRSLNIVATPSLAAGLVPAALARLGTGAPLPAQMHLHSTAPEKVVHAVLTGAAEVGVTSLPLEHRDVALHWIGQASCVVALHQDDPLAAHEVVPLAACAQRTLVTMQNPYRLRRHVDRALAQARIAVPARIDTNTSLNALALVRAGLGMAVLEPVTTHGVPVPGVAVRRLDVDIPFHFCLITPQGRPPTPTVEALTDALADTAAQMLPGFVRIDPRETVAWQGLAAPDGLDGPNHAAGAAHASEPVND